MSTPENTPQGLPDIIRPYGDTTGDAMVQVSFTLPIPHDKRAEGAALQLAAKMGLAPALLVHAKAMGSDFTFFIVYGSVSHLVDLREVVVIEREFPMLSAKDVNAAIKKRLGRKLVVVGACIGTDAHTVGIDAILNIKGFAGEKGLEYYTEIKVVNCGAQVLVPELVARARAEKADAVLVSQVVTQKDAHIHPFLSPDGSLASRPMSTFSLNFALSVFIALRYWPGVCRKKPTRPVTGAFCT